MSEGAKIIVLALLWNAVSGPIAKGATTETVFRFNCLMPNILAKVCGRAIFLDSLDDSFFSGGGSGLADEILNISSFMINLKWQQFLADG